MKVFILKEGKEYNQGVAYLDDGTMVVVDNARRIIGKTIDIVVTSVLQTTAGKMIFGRYIERGAAHAPAGSRTRGRRARRAACRRRRAAVTWNPSVPLVADGLLSHPRHHCLHDRSRHGVARLEPVRSSRLLRSPVCARVVVADSEDDRRARRGAGPRPRRRPARRISSSSNHQSIYDTPVDLLFAAVPAADHREGVAGEIPRARLAPEARQASLRRPPASRIGPASSSGGGRWCRRPSLIVYAEGTRSRDGHVAKFKAGSFLLAIEARCRSSRWRSSARAR